MSIRSEGQRKLYLQSRLALSVPASTVKACVDSINLSGIGDNVCGSEEMASYGCFYCGGELDDVNRGEHIVPKALGGTVRIIDVCPARNVCNRCNNGLLSKLDKELVELSPISIAAARVMKDSPCRMWDTAQIDGLVVLVDVIADLQEERSVACPQVMFLRGRPILLLDESEFRIFGKSDSRHIVGKSIARAYRRLLANGSEGKLLLHYDHIPDHPGLLRGSAYPPRIYFRRSLASLADELSFRGRQRGATALIGYSTSAERGDVLKFVSNVNSVAGMPVDVLRYRSGGGVSFLRRFDMRVVLRAMYKQAINLLAAYCPNTEIARETFPVLEYITDECDVPYKTFYRNGFTTVPLMEHSEDGHVFVMQYCEGEWEVYSSYFGGRVSTFVRLIGGNRESWRRLEVSVPLGGGSWRAKTSQIYIAHGSEYRQVQWERLDAIVRGVDVNYDFRKRAGW